MGRRKIEIQPITHERNRSVTFLKRKNGLFKKAYELGVLCSVDVAVIIFEERPGHHVKLYQYGSTDVPDIIQRHLRFDGEKDSRGPIDFANATPSKTDEILEDDDDAEDDQSEPPRSREPLGKRSNDGVVKTEYGPSSKLIPSTSGTDVPISDHEYRPERGPLSIPLSSVPIPHPPIPSSSNSSSLPISGERHSSLRISSGDVVGLSKKARLGELEDSGSRKGSDHQTQNAPSSSSGIAYSYPPSSAYRYPHQSTPYQHLLPVTSPHQQPSYGFGYSNSSRAPPTHSRSTVYSPRTYDHNPRTGFYPSQLSRQASHHHHPPSSPHNTELFGTFSNSEDRRQPSGEQQSSFGNLDWPAHAQSTQHTPQENDAGWLDFLSNNPSSHSSISGQLTMLPPPTARSREVLSWQRERSDTQPYSLEREDHTHSSAVAAPSEGRRRPTTTDHKMEESALDQDVRRGENEKRAGIDEKREKDSN